MKCETCKFAHIIWRKGDEFTNYGYGYSPPTQEIRSTTSVQCRRHAPSMSTHENRDDGWPYVSGDDWCGEYKPEENSHANVRTISLDALQWLTGK